MERAVRLVEHNGERFAKAIRAGPAATGRLVLAPDPSDETVRLERAIRTWPDDGSTRAVLARTNRELLPAVVVALGSACRSGRRGSSCCSTRRWSTTCWRAPRDGADDRRAAARRPRPGPRPRAPTTAPPRPIATASSAGRSATPTSRRFVDGHRARPAPRLAELRRDDAPLTLATAHATKGLEFDHVVVLGMEAGRFPSARAVSQADDPVRAYEEERRLGYVAWTRARRSLTLLYDPAVPSPFLLEAFSPDELGLSPAPG